MDRVKDITKIKLKGEEYLIKIIEKDSKVILLDSNEQSGISYAVIVQENSLHSNLKVGDILLDFTAKKVFTWNKEKYAVLLRHEIAMAVSADNFNKEV
jgi:hypothetical protein